MSKQITDITIFIDFVVDSEIGREYVDGASIQIRGEKFELIENVGLHSVVNTEQELWDNVELTIERMIEKGHKVDNPRVHVWRSHQTRTEVDYFKAIGRHV